MHLILVLKFQVQKINSSMFGWMHQSATCTSFKNLCDREGIDFTEFWGENSDAELYHFIGKDIVYFHSLFWPAMLEGSEYRKPTNVFAHGYVTVDGAKMSKITRYIYPSPVPI